MRSTKGNFCETRSQPSQQYFFSPAFALAERTFAQDPESALARFSEVTDPQLRERFLSRHHTALLVHATDWLDSLAAGMDERYREQIQRERGWVEFLRRPVP